MKYPISESLKKAIESLFDNPSIGFETIGAKKTLPPDWYQEGKGRAIPIDARARMLRNYLEESVSNIAAENEEYGLGEETERLRAEAIATLIALRELFLHIPEAFDD